MNEPIACNFGAFTVEQKIRYGELREKLKSIEVNTEELEDGYAISYPEEDQILLKLAEWITLEKICCPFIKFSLEVGDVENQILLKLRGSESVKIVLSNALGLS